MIKSYEDIPSAGEIPFVKRSTKQRNPHELFLVLVRSLGEIFKVSVKLPNDEHLDQVWVSNLQEANRVILNQDGIWTKGPTTAEPFRSLVPRHVIALEGEDHLRMRKMAQQALAFQVENKHLLPQITRKHVHRMKDMILLPIVAQSRPIANFDKIMRATALDIISEALFGTAWNAIEDYSETNVKAWNLARLMDELHWRVTDFSDRSWLLDRKTEPVGRLLEPLEEYISGEIKRVTDSVSHAEIGMQTLAAVENGSERKLSMLEYWILKFRLATVDDLTNLCLTFLTMGHENVATAVAWMIISLAESPAAQEELRKEVYLDQADEMGEFSSKRYPLMQKFFFETVRLWPSVPVVTRAPSLETTVCGYKIPVGTEIVIPLYCIHRDINVWGEDSQEFNLHRFDRPGCPFVTTNGFPDAQPFASGSRACIGRPLSLLEMKEVALMFLRNFQLTVENSCVTSANNFVSLRPGSHILFCKKVSYAHL